MATKELNHKNRHLNSTEMFFYPFTRSLGLLAGDTLVVHRRLTVWDCWFPIMFSADKIHLKFIFVSQRVWILVRREKSFQLKWPVNSSSRTITHSLPSVSYELCCIYVLKTVQCWCMTMSLLVILTFNMNRFQYMQGDFFNWPPQKSTKKLI